MMKWVLCYKHIKELTDYILLPSVLMDEEGYNLGEYELAVKSWHEDLYNKAYKTADSFSEHRYKMTFKDKNEANKMWLWIVANEPTYDELKSRGFTKSTW